MSFLNRFMRAGCAALVAVALLAWTPSAQALPQGNAIKDPKALLRNSLPIDNPTIRKIQDSIEDISYQLRAVRRWGPVVTDVKKADVMLLNKKDKILASVAETQLPQAETLISEIQAGTTNLRTLAEAENKDGVLDERLRVLDLIGDLEALMVPGFPFEVPEEYSNLPQLKGRATVLFKTTKGDLTAVLDGYSAPVSAGNFADLVERGFYNKMKIDRAEEFYVVQTGNPDGPEEGFIDPKTKKYRAVPLEILAEGDTVPTYGTTFEDIGRPLDQPVLPFSSYGAMAMARPGDEPDGGSSQFFFFLFEPELTPAGINLLDGRYAIFGYVTEGNQLLGKLTTDDQIISAKVVSGLENLVKPKA
ncbi:peptidylprolyl isomerase [filamentous cyanobacterium LEGE 11480]|uniref:peptidylprolyl isomerase n=1 Tax=Romeriopsis navalis LEGE 11480 TaxID=2777977 RepID=A0A928VPV3_9CYAN|nr:peptidylprolyl isomerase [Romeriopsis navalis]MBE9032295.1 peptidylprolyl isomerase [Romeriopsis navalis LEGE 11480]